MLNALSEQFDKTIEHFKQEISGLRTGRATPALVEDVTVEAYGTKQQLKAVASITVLDAKTIAIEPWDKSIIKDIESALRSNTQLGLNPVNDGKVIRLALPELTQERRAELIKLLHQKMEQARIAVRKIREERKDEIDRALKEKQIGEDERYGLQDELDTTVKEYNEKIKTIGEEKEKEIHTV